MLYELLPILRGWKPDRHSSSDQLVTKGETVNVVDDNTAGWLLSISFYSSDASCKIIYTIDQESYEDFLSAFIEPPHPIPYHNLMQVKVNLDTQSSQNQARYNVEVNRIIIVDKNEFLISLREVFYGKWARIFDHLNEKPLLDMIMAEAKKLGIKITKEQLQEKVLPQLRRYKG